LKHRAINEAETAKREKIYSPSLCFVPEKGKSMETKTDAVMIKNGMAAMYIFDGIASIKGASN
jgi:hypothetical protein